MSKNKLSNIIKKASKEIKQNFPIDKFKIQLVNRSSKKLGYYQPQSCFDTPIFKLDINSIKEASEDYDLSLYNVIFTTLLHELGHCFQDLKSKPFNEEEAEDFAYSYWRYGIIEKI